jgi:hypothetical protein
VLHDARGYSKLRFLEDKRTIAQKLALLPTEFPRETTASCDWLAISRYSSYKSYFSATTAKPDSIGPRAGAANEALTHNATEYGR